ncbi:MAG: hypothetical protein HC895_00515 [Leptolyngbyaceae cyanobacterium SM1_3_5]|nr:hypothetical protein [Leptolyngbyaceae cyanobacterium SM1_3_5]
MTTLDFLHEWSIAPNPPFMGTLKLNLGSFKEQNLIHASGLLNDDNE